jgi:hypothetical protein
MAEVARNVPGKVGEAGKDIGSKIKGLFGN